MVLFWNRSVYVMKLALCILYIALRKYEKGNKENREQKKVGEKGGKRKKGSKLVVISLRHSPSSDQCPAPMLSPTQFRPLSGQWSVKWGIILTPDVPLSPQQTDHYTDHCVTTSLTNLSLGN